MAMGEESRSGSVLKDTLRMIRKDLGSITEFLQLPILDLTGSVKKMCYAVNANTHSTAYWC